MNHEKRGELIGRAIGLLIIYIVCGAIFHFALGYDLFDTVRRLAIITVLFLIGAIPVVALTLLLCFITSKIKRQF